MYTGMNDPVCPGLSQFHLKNDNFFRKSLGFSKNYLFINHQKYNIGFVTTKIAT